MSTQLDIKATPPRPFEDVYREYSARVYWLCLTLVRNATVAEDLANDAFVSAFAAYDRVQPDPDGVLVWLFTIARNTVKDHWRKQARWRRLFDSMASSETSPPDAERSVELRAELREVLDAMNQLKPRDRMLVGLRVGGELSYAEVAATMGMAEHACTVATARALTRLRALLGRTE